jgi:hypothetical protein
VILDRLNLPIFEYSINKSLELVQGCESPFNILTDESVINSIQEAIKEHINENYMNDINNLIDGGMMDVDNDFS